MNFVSEIRELFPYMCWIETLLQLLVVWLKLVWVSACV